MLDKDFYIKNGLIFAFVFIVYLLVTWLMGIPAMSSGWNSLIQLALFFSLFIYFGKSVKTMLGGYMTLKQGFKNLYIILLLGQFIYLLFFFVLNTLIDPMLMSNQLEYNLEQTVMELEEQGAPEAQIDQVIEVTEMIGEYMYKMISVVGFFIYFAIFSAMGAIGVLIAAAITKKSNPNPFEEVNA